MYYVFLLPLSQEKSQKLLTPTPPLFPTISKLTQQDLVRVVTMVPLQREGAWLASRGK